MTIFLSLLLMIMLSVVMVSVFCVKVAADRMMLANAADQSMWSLFARYDRDLLEKYDVFFIDAGCGENTLNMAGLVDELTDAAEAVLNPAEGQLLPVGNQPLSVKVDTVAVTSYTLATDNGAYVLADEAMAYMKETALLQSAGALLDYVGDTAASEAEHAAQIAENAENGAPSDLPEGTEDAIASAASGGTASEAGGDSDTHGGNLDVGDGGSQNDSAQGAENVAASGGSSIEAEAGVSASDVFKSVMSYKKLRSSSVLNLVCPDPSAVSGKTLKGSALFSARQAETGMGYASLENDPSSVSGRLLLNGYITAHFGHFGKPEAGPGLDYPLEQILQGKNSDIDNLQAVVNKILMIREGINFLYIRQTPALSAQADAAGMVIATLLLNPELAGAISALIEVGWAYCESLLDVRTLLAGGKVAVTKSPATWQLGKMTDMITLSFDMDALRKPAVSGMTYEQYLMLLLNLVSTDTKCLRMADMMEHEIRASGRENFCIDHCLNAIGIDMTATAEGKVILTAEKNGSYRDYAKS
ncbi:MAG: DUF5702 domain-containing protein [Lachnospiraceae bacterium]|nr:DUF5702 domain-containing protein [Lachnospiraceae bacterium]